MRTITTSVDVYSFDELSESAQNSAVEALRERECSRPWDSHDIEQTEAAMVYMLAEKFRSPGWDVYGDGDFPGIDMVFVHGASTWN